MRQRLTPHKIMSFESMPPERQAALKQQWPKADTEHRRLIEEAVATRGGTASDYTAYEGKAYPKKHEPGGPDCPQGKNQCGWCHVDCDDPECGICEDRAICSIGIGGILGREKTQELFETLVDKISGRD